MTASAGWTLDFSSSPYVRDPRTHFIPIQMKLGLGDGLSEYVQHTGSALFAIPSGIAQGGVRRPGPLRLTARCFRLTLHGVTTYSGSRNRRARRLCTVRRLCRTLAHSERILDLATTVGMGRLRSTPKPCRIPRMPLLSQGAT